MKYFKWFLLIFIPCSLFGQESSLRTFSGKPIDKNTCIYQIKFVDIYPTDSLNNEIKKSKIEGFIDHLRACGRFSFNRDFKDREFKITVPGYLTKLSYELGDEKFGIVIRDSLNERTILFSYDLDDSYKNHFLTKDSLGFWKQGTVDLNGQKIYRFINYDKRNAGTIFTSNHLHVSYFTTSKIYEAELQEAISRFRW